MTGRPTSATASSSGEIQPRYSRDIAERPPNERHRFALSEFNAVANAFAYLGLTTLVEIATWLGRRDEAAKHGRAAAALKAAINARMFNGTALCDGLCSAINQISSGC